MKHGTLAGYTNGGCRAACCKTVKARYDKMRSLRAEQGPVSVPVIGARRRIQALRALGWTNQHIAKAAGYSGYGAIADVLYSDARHRMTVARHERIVAAYDALSATPGPSDETRRRAIAHGWVPPLAWDEASIDDPEASPAALGTEVAMTATDRLDEWAFLVRAGVDRRQAARQVGWASTGTVDTVARRHDRDDVLTLLQGVAA